MVKVYDFLWQSYIGYAKKYQLQVDSVADFNLKVAEVQMEIATILSPHYQENEMVRSYLGPWVRTLTGVTPSTGIISRPQVNSETFYRPLALALTDASGNIISNIDSVDEDELMVIWRIPQRQPSIAANRLYYTQIGQTIQIQPAAAVNYLLYYLVYPTPASVSFTQSVVNGEYVQTHNAGSDVDLGWDPNASNLLLYLLLSKYGVSSRDNLIAEYGKLGIQTTLTLSADGAQPKD